MADPHFGRAFLIPDDGTLRASAFNEQPVLRPAKTCETENEPRAPLSNSNNTLAKSSVLIGIASQSDGCSILPE